MTTKKARLYLYDGIGADYKNGIRAKAVSSKLNRLTHKTDLDIFINSPGGEVLEGIAIYNVLRQWPGKKTTHITGVAAGIASMIAMAGDEIIVRRDAQIMICEPSVRTQGVADELHKMADLCRKLNRTIIGVYAARTGLKRKQISADMKVECWMNAKEAVERGFADKSA